MVVMSGSVGLQSVKRDLGEGFAIHERQLLAIGTFCCSREPLEEVGISVSTSLLVVVGNCGGRIGCGG